MKFYTKTCTASCLLALVLAACASNQPASTTKSVEVGVQGNEAVRATVEIQGLRDELARLRNEIELQRNQLDKLTQRQRELYDDLDYRLRQRERGSGGDIALTQPPSVGGGFGSSDAGTGFGSTDPNMAGSNVSGGMDPNMQGTTGELTGGGTTPQTTDETAALSPSMSQPAMPQQAAIATPEEQAGYDEAFNLLKQSRYGESVAAFQQLLAQFPNGALADDAQYWIGEAMYVTRDFQNGLRAFQTVVDRYPESARVAEAMLKLGYIQYEIGAKEEARQTFTQVVNRFPGSRVAISAQTRLKKLQAEGG